MQFVITTTQPFGSLNTVVQAVMTKARADHKFYYIDADSMTSEDRSAAIQSRIDNDKIAALGITKQQVAIALGAALGGGYVNYFTIDGRAYQVIRRPRKDQSRAMA